jgi:hypothetical protein
MRLPDVFPRAEIAAAVPGAVFRDLDGQGLESFTADNPNTMIAFGFATWDHALSSGRHDDLDPQMLAGPINDEDPWFIRHVEVALGQRALLDFHYAEARTPGAPEPFASVSLAHLYPNHLHIGDVLLLDPNRPRQDSRWIDQKYTSLRLFGVLLENLRAAAAALGVEKLTLTAANRQLRVAFERHGFRLADTMGARMIEAVGADHGFPMERAV